MQQLRDRTRVGLWNGVKDFHFKDPSNYLEVSHKAPPAKVFRKDQDSSYTREEVQQVAGTTFGPRSHTLKSPTANLYEDLEHQRWHIEKGPGQLPEVNWEADLLEFNSRPEEKS